MLETAQKIQSSKVGGFLLQSVIHSSLCHYW